MGTLHESVQVIDGEELSCAQVDPGDPVPGRAWVVIMHGAGTGSKERNIPLAHDFADAGYPVIAFDFSGHGKSTGTLAELSLERRFLQAQGVIDRFVPKELLILLGFSMSGQTVADLVEHFGNRVEAIGLCSPAAYAPETWRVRFGDGFTEMIRQPRSWVTSRVFDVLAAYTGRSVLVTPEHDAVIPPGVTFRIEAALRKNSSFSRMIFPKADHRLGLWIAEHPEDRAEIVKNCTTP